MAFVGAFEDRIAIRELLETYADAVTRCDPVAWGETWTEDAEWLLPDYPEFGTTRGRDAIVTMWVAAMKVYPGVMFESWPGAIEVDGDVATVRCYTSEVYDQNGVTMRDRGIYEDICRKIDGRWYFASRSFRNIHRQQSPKGC